MSKKLLTMLMLSAASSCVLTASEPNTPRSDDSRGSSRSATPEGEKPEGAKPEGATPEGEKPEGEKPEGAKTADAIKTRNIEKKR